MWVRIKCFNLVETVCKTENAISSGYVAYIAAPISMQKRWKRQTNGHISTVSFGFRRDKAGRTKKSAYQYWPPIQWIFPGGTLAVFARHFPLHSVPPRVSINHDFWMITLFATPPLFARKNARLRKWNRSPAAMRRLRSSKPAKPDP